MLARINIFTQPKINLMTDVPPMPIGSLYFPLPPEKLTKLSYIPASDGLYTISQLNQMYYRRKPSSRIPKRLREKEFTTSISKRSRPTQTDDVKTPDSK